MHLQIPYIYCWNRFGTRRIRRTVLAVMIGCGVLTGNRPLHAADAPDPSPQVAGTAGGMEPEPNDPYVGDDRHRLLADSDPKTRHQNLLFSILHEPKLDATQRQQAALAILELGDPQAVQLLGAELRDAGDPATRRLIAGALILIPQPPPSELAPILLEALLGSESRDTDQLAEALGRYTDGSLIDRLATIATGLDQTTPRRRAAIIALGYHRTPSATRTLIGLIDTDADRLSADLRASAFTSLRTLTGISAFGQDRHRWDQWWQAHQDLDDPRWFAAITHRFTLARAQLASEQQRILTRLIYTQRQLYRTVPQAERPAMLVSMLKDPLVRVRQLGIDLCVQRLIDTRPIGAEVRQGLILRLDDRSAQVRRRATQLLHDLADEQAARVIAQRIFDRADLDPVLIRTQLQLITRQPQALAVPRVLDLLEQPDVADAAAGFLAAASEADLLDESQSTRAAAFMRKRLQNDRGVVKPHYVTLLARLGTGDDWELVARWLDNGDESLKRAAASAWAKSTQPLEPLLEHSDDPIIQEIVVTAARQRGDTPRILMALLAHRPEAEQAAQAWERAVLAVAGRVPTTAVLEADTALAERDAPLGIREQILTVAIDNRLATAESTDQDGATTHGTLADDQNNQTDDFILSQLLLARASVRLSAQEPVRALEDYSRVEQLGATLSPRLLDDYQFGLLDAHLATDAMDEALQMAERIIADASGSGGSEKAIGRVVDLFVKAVQRNLDAQQIGQTQMVLAQLRELLGQSLSDILNRRLVELEQQTLPGGPGGLDDPAGESSPTQDSPVNQTSRTTPRLRYPYPLPIHLTPMANPRTC